MNLHPHMMHASFLMDVLSVVMLPTNLKPGERHTAAMVKGRNTTMCLNATNNAEPNMQIVVMVFNNEKDPKYLEMAKNSAGSVVHVQGRLSANVETFVDRNRPGATHVIKGAGIVTQVVSAAHKAAFKTMVAPHMWSAYGAVVLGIEKVYKPKINLTDADAALASVDMKCMGRIYGVGNKEDRYIGQPVCMVRAVAKMLRNKDGTLDHVLEGGIVQASGELTYIQGKNIFVLDTTVGGTCVLVRGPAATTAATPTGSDIKLGNLQLSGASNSALRGLAAILSYDDVNEENGEKEDMNEDEPVATPTKKRKMGAKLFLSTDDDDVPLKDIAAIKKTKDNDNLMGRVNSDVDDPEDSNSEGEDGDDDIEEDYGLLDGAAIFNVED